MTAREIHYANPEETCFVGACFEFQFGAYGDTVVRVFQRPDHLEDALEIAVEWLEQNAPGHLVSDEEMSEAYREACTELGVDPDDFDPNENPGVTEIAEADLTYTEAGYLRSWEWHVTEITDPVQLAECHRLALETLPPTE